MIKLYDFMYCASVIDLHHVWYIVKVGESAADLRAHQALKRMADSSASFFYVRHSCEWAKFKQQVAVSLLGRTKSGTPASVNLLRHASLSIRQLWRKIQTEPLEMLNAEKATRSNSPT